MRLPAVEVSAPRHEFVPDEHAVRAALAMARDRDLCPPPGRDTTYPYLLPYALLPAYACHYTHQRVVGAVDGVEDYGRAALERPFPMFVVARLVVALTGALAAFACLRLAMALGAAPRGALVAGGVAATSLLLLLLSVQARPWIPVTLCTVLVFDGLARVLRGGARRRDVLLAGAAAGAAAGLHPIGWAAFVPFAAAAMAARRTRPRAALVATGLAFAVAAAGHPWIWLGIRREPSSIFAEAAVTVGGQGLFLRFEGARFVENLTSLLAAEPWLPALLVLAALATRAAAPSDDPARTARRVSLAFAGGYVVAFLLYFGTLPRYFLPALPILLAALAATVWPAHAPRRFPGAVVVLLVATGLTAVRTTWVLSREDTRVEVERALAAVDARGGVVAVEPHGPVLEHVRASLERSSRFDPQGTRARERAALDGAIRPPGPRFDWLPLERVFAASDLAAWRPGYAAYWAASDRPPLGAPRDPGDPLDTRLAWTLAAERVTVVVRAFREPVPASQDLTRWLEARGTERVLEVDPGSSDGRLPGEPRWGWFTLWTADRPGPRIVVDRVLAER